MFDMTVCLSGTPQTCQRGALFMGFSGAVTLLASLVPTECSVGGVGGHVRQGLDRGGALLKRSTSQRRSVRSVHHDAHGWHGTAQTCRPICTKASGGHLHFLINPLFTVCEMSRARALWTGQCLLQKENLVDSQLTHNNAHTAT